MLIFCYLCGTLLTAASWLATHTLALEVHPSPGCAGRLRLITCLDLRCHHHERLFYIGRVLGRRLDELNTQRICKLLRLVEWYRPFRGQIWFVAHQELVDIFRRVSVDLVQPLLDIVETLQIRRIVYYNDAVGASVITGSDCTESFLTCCVPLKKKNGCVAGWKQRSD